MEVVYIVPISGLLIALGVLVVLGIIWLWNLATEYENALIDFANESTDGFLLVVGIIVAVIGLIFLIFKYKNVVAYRVQSKTGSVIPIIFEAFIRLAFFVTPYILGISAVYGWSVFWINAIVETLAESVLMWISVPLIFIVFLVGFVIGVLLLLGYTILKAYIEGEILSDEYDGKRFSTRFLIPALVEVVGSGVFLLLVYTCTDFPTYLANSLVS